MKKRVLSLMLALALVFPIFTSVSIADAEVTRIAGDNRYATSVKLSETYDSAETVILASGETFPDALSGSGLASTMEYPLLLVTKDSTPNTVLEEIERLGAKKVIVLGGEGTVSEKALKKLDLEVERLAGGNRYETSLEIAKAIPELEGLIVVNGTSFPDALSAGSMAKNKAVILTDGKTLELPETLADMPITVLGGINSVSDEIVKKYEAKRVAGANRYETSLLASKLAGFENVLIADGTNYPDALSAITIASKMPASILLTSPAQINNTALEYVNTLNKAVIVGGINSVNQTVENALKGIVPEPKPEYGSYEVVKVVDGDTIHVMYNGTKESVRLIGVDTPESVHPDKTKNTECGVIASEFTKSRLEGKKVGLEFDVQERDKYGRILAYVWLDGKMFNKTLMEEGMAQVATFPPNVKYVDDFTALEKVARENKVGLWGRDCSIPKDEPNTPAPNPGSGYDPANPKDGLKVSPYPDRLIKGNISRSGEKIYHMPGQKDYAKTVIDESKGERWFATPAEAEAAGWRAAKR